MSDVRSVEQPAPAVATAIAKEPTGIGGWLLVIAVGQVVGVLRYLVHLGQYYSNPDNIELFSLHPVAAYGELAMHLGLFAFAIVVQLSFFGKSRHFPRLLITSFILAFLVPIADALWVVVTFSIQLNGRFAEYFLFGAEDIVLMILAAIGAAIWIPYVLKSRRVRNTFVH